MPEPEPLTRVLYSAVPSALSGTLAPSIEIVGCAALLNAPIPAVITSSSPGIKYCVLVPAKAWN